MRFLNPDQNANTSGFADMDAGLKYAFQYTDRQIATVQEILFLASDGFYAELHRRSGPQWITEIFRGADARLAQYVHSDGASYATANVSGAWRGKLGLGPAAPWFSARAAAGVENARETVRDALRYAFTATAGLVTSSSAGGSLTSTAIAAVNAANFGGTLSVDLTMANGAAASALSARAVSSAATLGVLSTDGAEADAIDSAHVDTFVADGTTLSGGGALSLAASSSATPHAESDGLSASLLVATGMSVAHATRNGATRWRARSRRSSPHRLAPIRR